MISCVIRRHQMLSYDDTSISRHSSNATAFRVVPLEPVCAAGASVPESFCANPPRERRLFFTSRQWIRRCVVDRKGPGGHRCGYAIPLVPFQASPVHSVRGGCVEPVWFGRTVAPCRRACGRRGRSRARRGIGQAQAVGHGRRRACRGSCHGRPRRVRPRHASCRVCVCSGCAPAPGIAGRDAKSAGSASPRGRCTGAPVFFETQTLATAHGRPRPSPACHLTPVSR